MVEASNKARWSYGQKNNMQYGIEAWLTHDPSPVKATYFIQMLPNCETVPIKPIKSIQILPNCETVPIKPIKPILQESWTLSGASAPRLLEDWFYLFYWYSFAVWQYLD